LSQQRIPLFRSGTLQDMEEARREKARLVPSDRVGQPVALFDAALPAVAEHIAEPDDELLLETATDRGVLVKEQIELRRGVVQIVHAHFQHLPIMPRAFVRAPRVANPGTGRLQAIEPDAAEDPDPQIEVRVGYTGPGKAFDR